MTFVKGKRRDASRAGSHTVTERQEEEPRPASPRGPSAASGAVQRQREEAEAAHVHAPLEDVVPARGLDQQRSEEVLVQEI